MLRKWQQERRIIQAALVFSETTNCCIVGRIKHVDSRSLKIDASSLQAGGHVQGLSLNIFDAIALSFEDWRDAPTEYAEQLRQDFDSFLFVDADGFRCEIYATKTGAEFS